MAKKPIDTNPEKLGRKIGGGLFRYTFVISLAAHLAVWGIVSMPKDALGGKTGEMKMGGKLNVTVVKKTYDDLPPPPSIEAPAETVTAPTGSETKGSVGEVPLPVPDELAEADTIADASAGSNTGVGEGTEIIVEGGTETSEVEAPWEEVNMDIEYSEPPVCVREERPRYPDIALQSGVEGDVVLLVYIDTNGDVRNAVIQSSPGLPALDEEAKKAAYKCKFRPAKQQGQPVGVWYSIVMQFRK